MRGEVVQWIFGEFIPFGDLVSDVALVVTLPRRDEAENSLLEDSSLYRTMRWLLWVGTVISLIPEIALFVGILTGMVVGIFLGPATWSTGGIGRGVLSANFEQVRIFGRYILSESKTITRFILYFTEDLPVKWDSAPALAAYCSFMPLFAITYPFMKLWGMVKPRDSVRVEHAPKRGQHEAVDTSAAGLWYGPLMFVQIGAGIMTEVASIFIAISTKEIISIVSAAFGLYYLTVSFLVSVLKGPKGNNKGETFKQRRQELAADVDSGLHRGCGNCWSSFRVLLAIVCCVCVTPVGFYGVYLIKTGDGEDGRIFCWVGFILFLIVWCVANSWTGENEGIYVGLGVLAAGFGVVYFLTTGPTYWVIALLAVGGGVSVCCCLAALMNHV
eukprot:g7536.t1